MIRLKVSLLAVVLASLALTVPAAARTHHYRHHVYHHHHHHHHVVRAQPGGY